MSDIFAQQAYIWHFTSVFQCRKSLSADGRSILGIEIDNHLTAHRFPSFSAGLRPD
jgi:hypothetical protein